MATLVKQTGIAEDTFSRRAFSRGVSFRAMSCTFCARAEANRGGTCHRGASLLGAGTVHDPVPVCPDYVSRARQEAREAGQPQGTLFDEAARTTGQAAMAF